MQYSFLKFLSWGCRLPIGDGSISQNNARAFIEYAMPHNYSLAEPSALTYDKKTDRDTLDMAVTFYQEKNSPQKLTSLDLTAWDLQNSEDQHKLIFFLFRQPKYLKELSPSQIDYILSQVDLNYIEPTTGTRAIEEIINKRLFKYFTEQQIDYIIDNTKNLNKKNLSDSQCIVASIFFLSLDPAYDSSNSLTPRQVEKLISKFDLSQLKIDTLPWLQAISNDFKVIGKGNYQLLLNYIISPSSRPQDIEALYDKFNELKFYSDRDKANIYCLLYQMCDNQQTFAQTFFIWAKNKLDISTIEKFKPIVEKSELEKSMNQSRENKITNKI